MNTALQHRHRRRRRAAQIADLVKALEAAPRGRGIGPAPTPAAIFEAAARALLPPKKKKA